MWRSIFSTPSSHPAKVTHVDRLYPWPCPFTHNPNLMNKGPSRNVGTLFYGVIPVFIGDVHSGERGEAEPHLSILQRKVDYKIQYIIIFVIGYEWQIPFPYESSKKYIFSCKKYLHVPIKYRDEMFREQHLLCRSVNVIVAASQATLSFNWFSHLVNGSRRTQYYFITLSCS